MKDVDSLVDATPEELEAEVRGEYSGAWEKDIVMANLLILAELRKMNHRLEELLIRGQLNS